MFRHSTWRLACVLAVVAPSPFASLHFGRQHSALAAEEPIGSVPTQPAAQPARADITQFDPNPQHLWSRLQAALLVRTTSAGLPVDDDMFPYLFVHGRHLLEGPSHEDALRIMDEFLATNGEKLIDDPRRRLMLQRDLWAVFDWCAWVPDDWVYMKKDEPAAKELRWRLAKIIQRLALGPHDIAAIPDNYFAALQSHAFPSRYDSTQRDQPFLPADLLDKDSPWVCIENRAEEHARAARDRSIFLALLQLPDGKQATEKYLASLAHAPAQFPVGTKVALLRQALAIDDTGHVSATNVTESLQIRVYREIPQGFTPGDFKHYMQDQGAWQDCYQFTLNRRGWFDGGHGLRAATPGDISLFFAFDRQLFDPFEKPVVQPGYVPPSPPSPPAPTLGDCRECHQSPGAYSVVSLTPFMLHRAGGKELDAIFPKSVSMAKTQAVRFKAQRADWAILQGMLDAYRSP